MLICAESAVKPQPTNQPYVHVSSLVLACFILLNMHAHHLSFFCVYFYFSTLCFYSVKTSLMYDADFVAQSRDAAYSAHTGQVGLQAVRQHWHG